MIMENLEQEIDGIMSISNGSTSMYYTGSLSEDEQTAIKEGAKNLVTQMELVDAEQLPKIYRKKVIRQIITTAITIGIGTAIGAFIDADKGSQILTPIGGYVGMLVGIKQIPRLMDYRNLITGLRAQFYGTRV